MVGFRQTAAQGAVQKNGYGTAGMMGARRQQEVCFVFCQNALGGHIFQIFFDRCFIMDCGKNPGFP
jgi:hypothetical protein